MKRNGVEDWQRWADPVEAGMDLLLFIYLCAVAPVAFAFLWAFITWLI